jgi:hypothetical protein
MDQIIWTIVTIAACLLVIGVVLSVVWAAVSVFLLKRVHKAQRDMFDDFDKKHRGFPF